MGDVAMLVPCILALTKKHPSLRITLLTRKRFASIFQDIPNITIFSANVKNEHKGVVGLYRLYKQLMKLNIDAVADTHNVLRSSILKVFFKFSRVPFVQIDKGRKEKKGLTRFSNKVFKPLMTTHERYAEVFEKLGLPLTLPLEDLLERKDLPEHFKSILGTTKNIIGIAPFAAYKSKMYPLSLMEGVIKKLSEHGQYKILLFGGGAKEIKILNNMVNGFSKNVINVAGTMSFEEELALISNLKVMVAMDSGNGHLAANYGVDVVTLWGVTHPYAGFAPFGQTIENSICADRKKYPLIPTSIYGNTFPEGYDKAMETINPDDVYQTVVNILEK